MEDPYQKCLMLLTESVRKMNDGRRKKCLMCNWIGSKNSLKNHTRSAHGHGAVEYQCDTCEKKCKRPEHLATHNSSVHLNIKHPCDKCDYEATRTYTLWRHKKSSHS